jgi:hypothetical protein
MVKLALCRQIRINPRELIRQNGRDAGWFLARSVSGINRINLRARGMILQLKDHDG